MRISVDALPGIELSGSLDILTGNGAGSTRFISEYLIIDAHRNQAYLVAYTFTADRMAPLHHGLDAIANAFRYLDSFHVEQ